MPVLTAEPPVVMGEVVGSIDERALVDAVFSGRAQLTDPLADFVAPAARSDRHARVRRGGTRGARDAPTPCSSSSDGKPAAVRHPPRPAGLPQRLNHPEPRAPMTPQRPADQPDYDFATRAIRAGQAFDPTTGAVDPAGLPHDHLRAGRHRRLPQRLRVRARRQPHPRRRCRSCSPRSRAADRGFSFASGLAAEDTLLRAILTPGDHVLMGNDVYGGIAPAGQPGLRPVGRLALDGRDERPRRGARTPSVRTPPRCVWIETPSNPLMKITRHRGRSPRSRTRPARSSSSTTPSPRPTCSARSRSAPTSSCTRPPSTSAATATCSAAPSC